MIQDHVLAVESAACRLRSRFSQAVDAPLVVRRQVLDEELVEILKDTLPADRRRLLVDLLKRFPVWGAEAPREIAENSRDLSKRVEQLEAELKNPFRLVERLREVLPQLAEDQRREVEKALTSGSLVRSGLSEAGEKAIREKLGLPPTVSLTADRLAEVAAELMDSLIKIDDNLAKGCYTYCGQPLLDSGGLKARLATAFAEKPPGSAAKAELEGRAWMVKALVGVFVNVCEHGGRYALHAYFLPKFKPSIFEATVRADPQRQPKIMTKWGEHFWTEWQKEFEKLERDQDELKRAFTRKAGDDILQQFQKYEVLQKTRRRTS